MKDRCSAHHPSLPIVCIAPARFPNHDLHFGLHEGDQVEWPNPNFVPPPPPPSKERDAEIRRKLLEIARGVRQAQIELPTRHVLRDFTPRDTV